MSLHAVPQPTCARQHRSRLMPVPMTVPAERGVAEPVQFRQLRHLTKNALQRILSIISSASEPESVQARHFLGNGLERRILIAAKLSDALFGLTSEPGSLHDRLARLSQGLIELFADDASMIEIAVAIQCGPSVDLDDLVVQVAHELIGNAVKHGMHQRLLGKIEIEVRDEPGRRVLTVADDGWGCLPSHAKAEGLSIVDSLLRQVGGTCDLRRNGKRTVATVEIPRRTGIVAMQPAS